jgi:hypothetical protein
MSDTIEGLRHQRNLLAEALGKLLLAYGIIRADAALTGPELLLAAEDALQLAEYIEKVKNVIAQQDIASLLSLLKRADHLMASRHHLHEDGITDATIAAAEQAGKVITSGSGAFDSVILMEDADNENVL